MNGGEMGAFKGFQVEHWGGERPGQVSCCSCVDYLDISYIHLMGCGPQTAGHPPVEGWECTSLGICKQLSLERNMLKSPPLGVRDIITIFRNVYKKIISDDLTSFRLFLISGFLFFLSFKSIKKEI